MRNVLTTTVVLTALVVLVARVARALAEVTHDDVLTALDDRELGDEWDRAACAATSHGGVPSEEAVRSGRLT